MPKKTEKGGVQSMTGIIHCASDIPDSAFLPAKRHPWLRVFRGPPKRQLREVPILLVGSSHTTAVSRALADAPDGEIGVLRLKASMLPRPGKRSMEFYRAFSPSVVISMIGGNQHLSLGLVEGPEPFDFEHPKVAGIDRTRRIIPHAEVRAALFETFDKAFERMRGLREAYRDKPMAHVSAPPPKSDPKMLANNLRSYQPDDDTEVKIVPRDINLKLHHLQNDILRDFCAEHEIDFIDPPLNTRDSSGFLQRQYWQPDAAHANKSYGAEVLVSVRSYAERVAITPPAHKGVASVGTGSTGLQGRS